MKEKTYFIVFEEYSLMKNKKMIKKYQNRALKKGMVIAFSARFRILFP